MNPLRHLRLIDDTLFLDNSALELISTCMRQAEYYLLWKREKNAERPALQFGGIVHSMLEVLYKDLNADTPTKIERMLAAATKGFEKWTPPEGEFRNYDTAVTFITEYLKFYPVESFTVAAVEQPFTVPFGEFKLSSGKTIRVVWQGRVDIYGYRDDKLFFMDHKTTSMMGPTYFKEFDLSSQFKGYAWATRQLTDQMPDYGVVNGLGIRKPTKTGKAFEFERYPVRFTADALDEWQQDTIALIGQFLSCYEADFFPRCTKWCVGKYGACQYFDVCVLPREQRETMLSLGDYRDVTWDPLAKE